MLVRMAHKIVMHERVVSSWTHEYCWHHARHESGPCVQQGYGKGTARVLSRDEG